MEVLPTVVLVAATVAAPATALTPVTPTCELMAAAMAMALPALLLPAAISLALFAWLLTLHPTASGRVYAAYGGVYVAMALVWLWAVDGVKPTAWDLAGGAVTLLGMAIIVAGPRHIA